MNDATGDGNPSADATEPQRAGFELSERQRDDVRALAASMSFVGVCLMLFGAVLALFAVVGVFAGFTGGGAGLLGLAIACTPAAWWTMSGGRSLSAILRTRGHDVDHLMETVRQLRRLFAFARAVVILETLLVTAIAAVFVWCNFVMSKADRCLGIFG